MKPLSLPALDNLARIGQIKAEPRNDCAESRMDWASWRACLQERLWERVSGYLPFLKQAPNMIDPKPVFTPDQLKPSI